MNLKPMGWIRVLRGLRQGNQAMLLTGLALVAFQRLRGSRGKRELVYRQKLPVGSAVVIRHQRPDDPKVGIRTRE
ncbi:MAG: hypothetical protein ACLFWM_01260 [Actinomycetota bacterium]